jgi:hypothetical protein
MNRPGHHPFDCAAPLGPVKPLRFAPTPSGLAGLTGASAAPRPGNYVMARGHWPDDSQWPNSSAPVGGGKEESMRTTNVSAVDITIGDETRVYHAFITTAPVTFDQPSTLTLEESSFTKVASFTAEPLPFGSSLGRAPARLVLVDRSDEALQRARYREGNYRLAPTDPVLVDTNTLEHWLWNRLTVPSAAKVDLMRRQTHL